MKSIEKLCEKYAIQNALDHGEAKLGPVMRVIMAAHAELRKEADKVKEILEQQIDFINSQTKNL